MGVELAEAVAPFPSGRVPSETSEGTAACRRQRNRSIAYTFSRRKVESTDGLSDHGPEGVQCPVADGGIADDVVSVAAAAGVVHCEQGAAGVIHPYRQDLHPEVELPQLLIDRPTSPSLGLSSP